MWWSGSAPDVSGDDALGLVDPARVVLVARQDDGELDAVLVNGTIGDHGMTKLDVHSNSSSPAIAPIAPPPSPLEIPTLDPWGLGLMTLLLAAAAAAGVANLAFSSNYRVFFSDENPRFRHAGDSNTNSE